MDSISDVLVPVESISCCGSRVLSGIPEQRLRRDVVVWLYGEENAWPPANNDGDSPRTCFQFLKDDILDKWGRYNKRLCHPN
jgi:hypothetical protein